jgi:hypothetical protein
MPLVVDDRVQETTSTTGTGTITLNGAVASFQSFSVIGNGNTTYYTITSGNGLDWEVGIGTYTSAGSTLARTTILASSNSGNAISLTGTSTVFGTYPADRAVYGDELGYIRDGLAGTNTGTVPMEYFFRLANTVAGANATGAQSVFGVSITLASATLYQFEGLYVLSKTAGTTSHTVSTLFGGTAVLNAIGYRTLVKQNATSLTTVGSPTNMAFPAVATAIVQTAALTTAVQTLIISVQGTVAVTTGGTFIPQYSLSAAPGGAYTAQIGSRFKISPVAAFTAATNTNIGGWA